MTNTDARSTRAASGDAELQPEPWNGHQDVDFGDPAALARIARRYDEIIGGSLSKQRHAVGRGGGAPKQIRQYPFAWAIRRLSEVGRQQLLDPDDVLTSTALWWIGQFQYLDRVWSRNPDFAEVAQTLKSSFHHTLGELLIADLLRSGAADVEMLGCEQSLPTPDLRVSTHLGVGYIEIKAPETLQWTEGHYPSGSAVNKAVHLALDGVGRQLDKDRPGLLAVVSTVANPHMIGLIERAAQIAMRRLGERRPQVSGILICSSFRMSRTVVNGQVRMGTDFMFGLIPNPHTEGHRDAWAKDVIQRILASGLK